VTIDVRGISPVNRGAQLMLRAVVDRLGSTFELSSNPWQGDYGTRARLGLGQTLHHYKYRRASVALGNRVPRVVGEKFGFVRDRDITAVLDASGFAYSDSFSLDRHEREAFFGRRWQKAGVPKVMLPQAFGAFKDQAKAALTREIISQAEVVFARDDVSLEYLEGLGSGARILRSVDFTIGLVPASLETLFEEPFAAIVPNAKLVSTGTTTRSRYIEVLRSYMAASRALGLRPVVVVHEDGDTDIANELAHLESVTVLAHSDPLVLKAMLAQAEIVVASRFHAVVGALAMGVPSVALGWSHKYAELVRDFGVPTWVTELEADAHEKFQAIYGDREGRRTIAEKKPQLVAQVDDMWATTIRAIN
jgi:polysaccharide pyruvyl transferase WcaK-like protein